MGLHCQRRLKCSVAARMRVKRRSVLLAIASFATAPAIAIAQSLRRSPLKIVSAFGLISRTGLSRPVVKGDLLRQGDLIKVGKNSTLRAQLDYRQGYLVASEKTLFEIDSLRGDYGAAQTVIILRTGRLYHGLRRFSSKYSSFVIYDYARARSARVVGTQFQVAIGSGAMIVGVVTGEAATESGGSMVAVPSGMATVLMAGQPPTQPTPIDTKLSLEVIRHFYTANKIVILAKIHPTNQVVVGDQNLFPDPEGYLEIKLPRLLWATREIKIRVINAGGTWRNQEITVPLHTEKINGRAKI